MPFSCASRMLGHVNDDMPPLHSPQSAEVGCSVQRNLQQAKDFTDTVGLPERMHSQMNRKPVRVGIIYQFVWVLSLLLPTC